jgi:peptide/nickel transport system substrate-binding protein
MQVKHWALLLFAVLLVGALASCAPAAATPEAEEPTTAPEEEVEEPEETEAPGEEETQAPEPTEAPTEAVEAGEGGVAVLIFTQEFDTLNPYYTQMWFSAITMQFWNHHAWEFDENNAPFPVLVTEIPSAENGGVSEDGTILTLTLRDDIVWSDGEPITADDFVFTYEMIMDDNNAVASRYPYDLIESVEAADERTVVVTFTEPFAGWLATLWEGLLPAHVLRPVFEADGTLDTADWNLAPTVGSGPYVFAEWESGSFARFVANDNYWLGRPSIDEIFIRFVPDDASQVAALLAGDGDLGTFIAYSDIPALEAEGVQIVTVNSGYNEGFYFYLDPENGHPALQDVRVRQAIALGIDREAINRDLLLGLTEPAVTLWDNTPYQDPSLEPWPYDPERAMELLDEAGWTDTNGDGTRDKDGVELVLIYGTTNREIRQDTQAWLGRARRDGTEPEADADLFFSVTATAVRLPPASDRLSTRSTSSDPDTADPLENSQRREPANEPARSAVKTWKRSQQARRSIRRSAATFQEISQTAMENVHYCLNDRRSAVVSRLQNVRCLAPRRSLTCTSGRSQATSGNRKGWRPCLEHYKGPGCLHVPGLSPTSVCNPVQDGPHDSLHHPAAAPGDPASADHQHACLRAHEQRW